MLSKVETVKSGSSGVDSKMPTKPATKTFYKSSPTSLRALIVARTSKNKSQILPGKMPFEGEFCCNTGLAKYLVCLNEYMVKKYLNGNKVSPVIDKTLKASINAEFRSVSDITENIVGLFKECPSKYKILLEKIVNFVTDKFAVLDEHNEEIYNAPSSCSLSDAAQYEEIMNKSSSCKELVQLYDIIYIINTYIEARNDTIKDLKHQPEKCIYILYCHMNFWADTFALALEFSDYYDPVIKAINEATKILNIDAPKIDFVKLIAKMYYRTLFKEIQDPVFQGISKYFYEATSRCVAYDFLTSVHLDNQISAGEFITSLGMGDVNSDQLCNYACQINSTFYSILDMFINENIVFFIQHSNFIEIIRVIPDVKTMPEILKDIFDGVFKMVFNDIITKYRPKAASFAGHKENEHQIAFHQMKALYHAYMNILPASYLKEYGILIRNYELEYSQKIPLTYEEYKKIYENNKKLINEYAKKESEEMYDCSDEYINLIKKNINASELPKGFLYMLKEKKVIAMDQIEEQIQRQDWHIDMSAKINQIIPDKDANNDKGISEGMKSMSLS